VVYGTPPFLPIAGNGYGVNADSSSFTVENSTIYGAGNFVNGNVYGIRSVQSTATILNSFVFTRDFGANINGISYGIYLEKNPSTEIAFSLINDNFLGGDIASFGIASVNSKLDLHDNFSIRGGNSPLGDSIAVSLDNSDDSVIRNNGVIEGGDNFNGTSSGIIIDTSSNILIENNSVIIGGDGIGSSYGVWAMDANGLTINGNSTISGGGATLANYGLIISGLSNNSVVQNNAVIKGGTTGAGEIYGITVMNAATPVIRDNQLITSGETSGDDTVGIWVRDKGAPKIIRNVIRGGVELGNNKFQYGVKYENAAPGINGGILMNNFITGSDDITRINNTSFAVFSINTDIKMLNNTVIGTVRPVGNGDSYAFWGAITNSWIINNIIIGGLSGNQKYGLFFDDLTSPSPSDGTVIYNNIFDQDNCDDYLKDVFASGGGNDVAADVNSQPFFTTNPDFNREYIAGDGIVYGGGPYDFHVLSDPNNKLRNKGYSAAIDPIGFPTYGTIYNKPGALFDIDKEAKSTNYGKIDFGADEFDFN
jgi:hypothetical protein